MKKKHIIAAGKNLLKSKIKLIKEGEEKVLYSAVVLDDDARSHLINIVKNYVEIPFNWKKIAHHMTIVFKEGLPPNLKDDIGNRVPLTLKKIGISEDAIAVEVDGYPSKNKIPHITIAIPQDGKPFNSNLITDWKPIEEDVLIYGKVSEIKPNMLKEEKLKFNSDDTQTLDTKLYDILKKDTSEESKQILSLIDDEVKKKKKTKFSDIPGLVTSYVKSISDDFQANIISHSPVSAKAKIGSSYTIKAVIGFTLGGKKYDVPSKLTLTADMNQKIKGNIFNPNISKGIHLNKINLNYVGNIPVKSNKYKGKYLLENIQNLDTLLNRKLLNIVAKKFDLNFRYNDLSNPIIDQMRSKGIFNFLDQTMVLDYQKITELCWLIFLNGPIDYLTDPIKTDETFYVYEVGYYGEIQEDEVELDGDCGDCDGYGETTNECPECQGSGEYDYGEGDVECEICAGAGEIEDDCFNCEGSGVDYRIEDEYHLTDNTLIFYSNEPNLDKPLKTETGWENFEKWYEENSGVLIPMVDKWSDTESSFERDDFEDVEGSISEYYPQGDIHFENIRYRTYFRNLIQHR